MKSTGKTTTKKPKLYVGCSLTNAPETFKQEVEKLKIKLASDWDVLHFLGLKVGTPEDVYRRDILEHVANCDAFLAICDEPSIGLGWELCTATMLGKPTLAVAQKDAHVTRILIGIAAFNPNFSVERYQDLMQDVPRIAGKVLKAALVH